MNDNWFRLLPKSVKRRCLALKGIANKHEIIEHKYKHERQTIRTRYSDREPASNFRDCLLPVASSARDLELEALFYFMENDFDFSGLRERLKNCEELCKRILTNLANIDWELNEYEDSTASYNSELEASMTEYNKELTELYTKRQLIIEGKREPGPDEYNLPIYAPLVLDDDVKDEQIEGVPEFWYQTLSTALGRHIIQPHDLEPLKYLSDVRYYYDTERDLPVINSDKRQQILLFYFQKNPHFSNKILSKSLHIDKTQSEGQLMFDGVCVTRKNGCAVNWFHDEVSATTEQQLKEESGDEQEPLSEATTVARDEHSSSFFDFFTETGLEPDRTVKRSHNGVTVEVELDYEVFARFRDFIAPHAVVTYSRGVLAGYPIETTMRP